MVAQVYMIQTSSSKALGALGQFVVVGILLRSEVVQDDNYLTAFYRISCAISLTFVLLQVSR